MVLDAAPRITSSFTVTPARYRWTNPLRAHLPPEQPSSVSVLLCPSSEREASSPSRLYRDSNKSGFSLALYTGHAPGPGALCLRGSPCTVAWKSLVMNTWGFALLSVTRFCDTFAKCLSLAGRQGRQRRPRPLSASVPPRTSARVQVRAGQGAKKGLSSSWEAMAHCPLSGLLGQWGQEDLSFIPLYWLCLYHCGPPTRIS